MTALKILALEQLGGNRGRLRLAGAEDTLDLGGKLAATSLQMSSGFVLGRLTVGDGPVEQLAANDLAEFLGDIGSSWGGIGGLLSDQTDLQDALDAKADSTAVDAAIADLTATVADKADADDVTAALTSKADASATTAALALKANLADPHFTGVPLAPTASAGDNSTKLSTTAYVDAAVGAIIAAADAMVFKGSLDCSANPNYPAADRGWTYKVSVAGKIGGAAGVNVEVGDTLLCMTDGTSAGTQAAVGAQWNIVQANLDGAVIGPASSVNNHVAVFSGASGKLIADSGLLLSGSNTGDQTSIVGITGTLAQFNTAVTDADLASLAGVESLSNKTLAAPTLTGLASGDRLALSPTANNSALAVSGFSLTGANAQSLLDLAAAWNTTGTPTALKVNVTDTASNAASLLADLQVGGSSKFKVGKDGTVTLNMGAQGTSSISMVSGRLNVSTALNVVGSSIFFGNGWNSISGGTSVSSGPLVIAQTGASNGGIVLSPGTGGNLVEIRNGVNAQKLRIANTYTDGSNLQALSLATASGVFTIAAEGIGTGASGDVDIALTPLNSGKLKFGAHTALGAETVTGYITIKDAAGNARKLAVVS